MGRPKALGRPVAADGEETRKRILAAAVKQLGEQGYAGATLSSIAAGAGLTSGALYHYFDSKKRLVAALAADMAKEIDRHLQAVLVEHEGFVERCSMLLGDDQRARADCSELAALAVTMLIDGPRYPELRAALKKLNAVQDAFYVRLVDDAVARGELRPDTDARSIADLLTSLSYAVSLLALNVSAERHRAAARRLTELLAGRMSTSARPEGGVQSAS